MPGSNNNNIILWGAILYRYITRSIINHRLDQLNWHGTCGQATTEFTVKYNIISISSHNNNNKIIILKIGDTPKLRDLDLLKLRDGREVRIIKSIAAEWVALAIGFGFEGMAINTIRKGAFYQPDDACCKMLTRWLNREEGLKPPTWYNLIQCLEETDKFSSLTRDIKEAIMLKGGTLS